MGRPAEGKTYPFRMPFRPDLPYNDLPPLPPSAELETPVVLRKAIRAGRALAEWKGMLSRLPNSSLFLDTLHLQEAQASSAIENIVTTGDELYRSSLPGARMPPQAVKEVLAYKEALWFGIRALRDRPLLHTNLFVDLVRIIQRNDAGIRRVPGTRLVNPATGRVIYTPPEGEAVLRDLLANLERYLHEESDSDPLIKMAVMHYQFEAIHPFHDGNGRTGRILLLLYLYQAGLLDVPALFLSRYILAHRAAYYRGLSAVTAEGAWEPWLLYMLDMVERTATADRSRILAIEQAMEETAVRLEEALPGRPTRELLECLFRLPYVKRQNLVEAGLGTLKTAGNYLARLEEAGLLRSETAGREKWYVNDTLLALLTRESTP
jgi:Fic family protein